MLKPTKVAAGVLVACGGVLLSAGVLAQDQGQQLERVTITGSNIKRTDVETPSPVQVITAEDLKSSGLTSVQDVLHNLAANGQGTLSQGFSGAFASGAAGVALRGLTVGATLVLIDGRRMAPYPIGDDGQRSFVDISNIPFDAVERIEILKDGASAVYGSDAIAGVVNIILKRSFVGGELSADVGGTAHSDGGTYRLSGVFGRGDLDRDGHNFYIAVEARKQNQIKYADRPGKLTRTDYSGSGGYDLTGGRNNPLEPQPRSATGYVTNAAGDIIGFMPGCNASALAAGDCAFRDTWTQIQPATENYNFASRYTQSLSADWQMSVQATYFISKAEQVNEPARSRSFQGVRSGPGITPSLVPALGQPTIPNTNPSFPSGVGLDRANLYYRFPDPSITYTDAKAARLVTDLKGTLGDWDVDGALGYTEVRLDRKGTGYINYANFQSALDSLTDPYIVGGPNSSSVREFVSPTLRTKDASKLYFAHVGAGRSVYNLPGGPLSLAFGIDYFHREQDARAPQQVADGLVRGFSNNFTVGKQDVSSAYVEAVAPVLKQLEIETAVRYDRYNISGGKASPKVGFKYTPIPEIAIRGTAARGFRAPGPSENGDSGQTYFAGTSADPILCPDGNPATEGNFVTQCSVAVATLQGTNAKLKPETSKSFTLGLIFEPIKSFSSTIDLYSIEVDDQIISGGPTTEVRGTDLTPLARVQPDGTTRLETPPVAPIAYKTIGYVNANTTKTQGVELGLQFRDRISSIGDFKSEFYFTHVTKYDITIDGVTYKLAGTHGPSIVSGDTGNPRNRFQWSNTLSNGPWQITGTINYVGPYSVVDPSSKAFGQSAQSTCLEALTNSGGAAANYYGNVLDEGRIPRGVGCKVGSFTTFDLYGRYEVTKRLTISGSILNLFNAKYPDDWANYAGGQFFGSTLNPSLHLQGAIGRYFTLGARYTF